MKCRISRDLRGRLRRETHVHPRLECCGLLLGNLDEIQDFVPIPNDASDPATAFEFDHRAHLDAVKCARGAGLAVVGHYHSHPGGSCWPSPTDAERAVEQGRYWMILTASGEALWISRRGGRVAGAFEPVLIEVADAPPCQPLAQRPIGARNIASTAGAP
jgi:desampylase